MKNLFFTAIVLLWMCSCRKDNVNVVNQRGTNLNYTPVPASSPVNTNILVYIPGNVEASNPFYMKSNGMVFSYSASSDGYVINNITTDQYTTSLLAYPLLTVNNPGFDFHKTFTVSNAIKNYVDLKPFPLVDLGDHNYTYNSGTLSLPNGSEILVPSYSYASFSGPGDFGLSAGYLNPRLEGYAISLPCYPLGDDNNKRWFLDSRGIYFLLPHQNLDFNPAVNIVLRSPIAMDQLAGAPDSIAVWNINSLNVWEKNGYAHKAGSYYEKQITRKGYWNFAVPEDGIYLTLHLRTTTGIEVPNTRIKLKCGQDEIADARTDADGNALVFVPSNKNLTLDLINDHFGNWSAIATTNQSLGAFNTEAEKTYVIADRKDLATIEGAVFNCDGSLLKSGIATLTLPSAKDSYIFPITDGKFKASTWISYGFDVIGDLDIRDNAGMLLTTNTLLLKPGIANNVTNGLSHYNLNFYSCSNASKLSFNYMIDTTNYTINGEATASSPVLTKSAYIPFDVISLEDNGKGITFSGNFTALAGNGFAHGGDYLPTGIKVNGVTCQFDDIAVSELLITRNDSTIGGYIEGWFLAYYKDNNNVSHKITGNFRVKITS